MIAPPARKHLLITPRGQSSAGGGGAAEQRRQWESRDGNKCASSSGTRGIGGIKINKISIESKNIIRMCGLLSYALRC